MFFSIIRSRDLIVNPDINSQIRGNNTSIVKVVKFSEEFLCDRSRKVICFRDDGIPLYYMDDKYYRMADYPLSVKIGSAFANSGVILSGTDIISLTRSIIHDKEVDDELRKLSINDPDLLEMLELLVLHYHSLTPSKYDCQNTVYCRCISEIDINTLPRHYRFDENIKSI